MTTETKTYNGWHNYETWAVALWIDNDQGTYEWARDLAREARSEAADPDLRSPYWTEAEHVRFTLADNLKESLEEQMPEVEGMWADLLNAAFSEVDWQEIADHYLDEQ